MSDSSRRDIFDALTCNSSADGCDGDWRASILANANSKDLKEIREAISVGFSKHTKKELRTSFIRQKKI